MKQIWKIEDESGENIKVLARAMQQHVWNEAVLVGCTPTGIRRVLAFLLTHPHACIAETRYLPRCLGAEK